MWILFTEQNVCDYNNKVLIFLQLLFRSRSQNDPYPSPSCRFFSVLSNRFPDLPELNLFRWFGLVFKLRREGAHATDLTLLNLLMFDLINYQTPSTPPTSHFLKFF